MEMDSDDKESLEMEIDSDEEMEIDSDTSEMDWKMTRIDWKWIGNGLGNDSDRLGMDWE